MITKLGLWVGIATLLNPIYYRSGRMHRGHAPLTLIAKRLEAEVSAAFLTELLMDDHQTWHVGWYCHPTEPYLLPFRSNAHVMHE